MARRGPAQPLIWTLGEGAPPSGPHLAVVPGAEAPLLPLDLPPKLRGIARERVAQRILTEHLGLPLEELEVRPFAVKGPWTRAVVGAADRMQAWRARLGPGCLALLPDYLALPCAAGIWTVEADDAGVRARLGVGDGFSAEPDLAAALLAEAAEREPPQAVLRLGAAEPAVDAVLAGLNVPVVADAAALVEAGHEPPMRWVEAAGGIDLKDPPRADFDRLRGTLRRWRAPVAVAVLALAAYLGSVAVETGQLRAARDRDRGLAEALVRDHFVPAGPILDIRAQVTAAVEAAAGPETGTVETDPLVLFQTAAPFLTGDDIRLQTVAYRADTGLVAAVEIADFAGLDRLVADLRADRFEVELLESSARQGAGVAARLRLLRAE
ncbi:MAG: type II secretion system protein GspL [Rhodobacter sp.]|nr:type II secretion system protein GspL [Rhodobacter sp.]